MGDFPANHVWLPEGKTWNDMWKLHIEEIIASRKSLQILSCFGFPSGDSTRDGKCTRSSNVLHLVQRTHHNHNPFSHAFRISSKSAKGRLEEEFSCNVPGWTRRTLVTAPVERWRLNMRYSPNHPRRCTVPPEKPKTPKNPWSSLLMPFPNLRALESSSKTECLGTMKNGWGLWISDSFNVQYLLKNTILESWIGQKNTLLLLLIH